MKIALLITSFLTFLLSSQSFAEAKTRSKNLKAPSPESSPVEPRVNLPAVSKETTRITKADESNNDGYGKTEGVAGPVVFGPILTAAGFPSPFRFGIDARGYNYFGMGLDYGFLPTLDFSAVKIKYNSWRVLGRFFPFQGAFFLGVGFGKQNLTGSSSNTVQTAAVSYSIELSTTILTPHLGWRWTGQSGLFFGMEFGLQLASSSTSTFSSDAATALQGDATFLAEKAKIEDEARKLGNTTLPHFALLQIGYLF